ncbi:MAG TPA: hypothetical protein VGO84_03545 [Burkholderiales bacterium]|nr:hypothetical protein [Burkholderiales bacterium]
MAARRHSDEHASAFALISPSGTRHRTFRQERVAVAISEQHQFVDAVRYRQTLVLRIRRMIRDALRLSIRPLKRRVIDSVGRATGEVAQVASGPKRYVVERPIFKFHGRVDAENGFDALGDEQSPRHPERSNGDVTSRLLPAHLFCRQQLAVVSVDNLRLASAVRLQPGLMQAAKLAVTANERCHHSGAAVKLACSTIVIRHGRDEAQSYRRRRLEAARLEVLLCDGTLGPGSTFPAIMKLFALGFAAPLLSRFAGQPRPLAFRRKPCNLRRIKLLGAP